MNDTELREVLIAASKLAVKEGHAFENLVYPTRNQRHMIREPELKLILSFLLFSRRIRFGVEFPTQFLYRFSGSKPDRANTDLLIEPGKGQVLVELKDGQPDVAKIAKDFEKMRREDGVGACFFHVLRNTNKMTLPRLLSKYRDAYLESGMGNVTIPKWFTLFITVTQKRRYWCKTVGNLMNISPTEFLSSSFDSGLLESDSVPSMKL